MQPCCRRIALLCTGLLLALAAAPGAPLAAAAGDEVRTALEPPVEAAEGALPASAAAAAAAATASAPAPPSAAPAQPAGEEKFSLIVVFRDSTSLAALRAMCNPSAAMYRIFHRGLRLPSDCHFPGMCRRIYSKTIYGFAGEFHAGDLARLERCLPGAIFYKEPDAMVYKAEDSSVWHPEQGQRSQQQQQQQLQQQQQERKAEEPRTRGRHMQQVQIQTIPRVTSFEERTRTPATESGPIDQFAVSQGVNISLPGAKRQTVSPRLWNLDRLDQRELPLDGFFTYGTATSAGTGRGATIYVVDSGIKPTHQEFQSQNGGRSRALYGFDFVEDDYDAEDCDGHGTHVAGSAVGLQVGVAKEAEVVAVRILDCTGSGTISDTVAGLDWVAANHKKPAVVTLSLGIQVGSWSRVLEDAVRSLINVHGITVVVASGNSGVDACYVAPANVPEVITVAASNVPTKFNGTKAGDPEDIYKWSNTGACLDIFAPGVDIFSACGGPSRCETVDDSAYTYASGTSMAVPHVAGVAAVYLADHPTATPREVAAAITGSSTLNKIASSKFKPGTPNRLLYSVTGSGTAAPPAVQAASSPPAAVQASSGPPVGGRR